MNNSFIVGLPNNKKAVLDTLSVEANGVYTPTSPVDGYSEVTVNIPAGGGDDLDYIKYEDLRYNMNWGTYIPTNLEYDDILIEGYAILDSVLRGE